MIELNKQNIDIAFITEPCINIFNQKIAEISSDFKVYFYSEQARAALIIRKTISHYFDYSLSNDDTCVVHVNNRNNSSALVSLYLSPSEQVDLTSVENIMLSRGHSTLICSDMNMHSTLAGYAISDRRAMIVEEFALTFDLTCKNIPSLEIKTFKSNWDTRTTVDYTFCTFDLDDKINNWRVDETVELVSDHIPIFFELNLSVNKVKTVKSHNLFRTNFGKLNEFITKELNESEINDLSDPNAIWIKTEQIINNGIEKYAPKTKIINKKNHWWNEELETMRKQLKRTQRYEKHKYKAAKLKYTEACQKAKYKSLSKFMTEVANENEWFKKCKIFLLDKKQESHPIIKLPNGSLCSSAEGAYRYLLNANFPELPVKLTSFQESVRRFVERELTHFNSPQTVPPFTKTEVNTAIFAAPSKKAPGIDEIETILYKNSTDSLLNPLTTLFNKILETGNFPDCWKESKVAFLKKPNKVDYTSPKSYRPISLLNDVSKIFERVLNNRLKYHVENHHLICELQFGFRSGIAAEQSAFKLANDIYTGFKAGHDTTAIFLDVANAFPTVWPDGLVYKLLQNSKIPKIYTKILHSYLTNRSSAVAIDETNKISKQLNRGIPQGSVLSPILWNLFANDLFDIPKKYGVKMISFADDTVIYITTDDPKLAETKLNKVLDLFHNWSRKWLIEFSIEKTKAVHFSRKYKQNERYKPILKMNNKPLEMVNDFKYLGIIFDKKLTWKTHLEACLGKTAPHLNKFRAICKKQFGLPSVATKMLIERVITPGFTYGCLVWCPALSKDYNRKTLTKFDRLASLAVTSCYKTTGTEALLVLSGLIPLNLIIEKLVTTSLFNIISNPKLIKTLCIQNSYETHLNHKAYESSLEKSVIIFQKSHKLTQDQSILHNLFTQRILPTELPHPALELNDHIKILTKKKAKTEERNCNTHLKIYVDASRYATSNIGYAAVAVINNNVIKTVQGSLNKDNSIFNGEVKAINLAIKMTGEIQAHSTTIFTDSNAAAGALLSRNTNNRLVAETRLALATINDNNKCELIWIPGHSNIAFNELADREAKAATSLQPEPSTAPKCEITRITKTRILNDWKDRWVQGQDCKFTRSLYSEPRLNSPINSNKLLTYHERRVMFKAASGHFPSRSHLNRIGKLLSHECTHCYKTEETVDHIIRDCPLSTLGNILTDLTNLSLYTMERIFNDEVLMKHAAIKLIKYLEREGLSKRL